MRAFWFYLIAAFIFFLGAMLILFKAEWASAIHILMVICFAGLSVSLGLAVGSYRRAP
jgi:hypothetical protein